MSALQSLQFTIEVSPVTPEQRIARKLRLIQLAAQRPGQTGNAARATLGELYRQQQAAQAVKAAQKPVRHDYVDDKSVASGHDERGTDGSYEEKW